MDATAPAAKVEGAYEGVLTRPVYCHNQLAEEVLKGVLSIDAIYDALHSGELRSRRFGAKFLVPRSAVVEFIEGLAQ